MLGNPTKAFPALDGHWPHHTLLPPDCMRNAEDTALYAHMQGSQPTLANTNTEAWGLGICVSEKPPCPVLPEKLSFWRAGAVPGTTGAVPRTGASRRGPALPTPGTTYFCPVCAGHITVLKPLVLGKQPVKHVSISSIPNKQAYFQPSQAVMGSKEKHILFFFLSLLCTQALGSESEKISACLIPSRKGHVFHAKIKNNIKMEQT